MKLPLQVFAELSIEVDNGREIMVKSEWQLIAVELPNIGTGWSAAKPFMHPQRRRSLLHLLHQGLQMTDLDIDLRIAGREIARLGPSARPGWLSRLIGVAPVQIKLFGLIRAVLHW